MKKTLVFFLSVILTGSVFISSCKKSSSDPVVNNPELILKNTSGYISSNQSVPLSSPLLFGVTAKGGDWFLTRFLVTRTFRTKVNIVKDSVVNTPSLNFDILASSLPIAENETWIFKVFTSRGDSLAVSIVITTLNPPPAGPIFTWSAKVVGAQISTSGHFLASSSGTVYSIVDAKINAALIDIVYFWDPADNAIIAGPGDASAQTAYNDPTDGISTWPVKNSTLFKKVTDNIDWPKITNDSMLVVQNQSGVTLSRISQIASTEFYAFTTAGGKKGMIQIRALSPEATGTVTLDVKVQQ
jgi:hypothetical protein